MQEKQPAHSSDCDLDPEELTLNKDVYRGEKITICSICYQQLLEFHQNKINLSDLHLYDVEILCEGR